MELHTLAQVEADSLGIQLFPALCQTAFKLHILGQANQRIIRHVGKLQDPP